MIHGADPVTKLFQLAESWFNQRLADGGPRYAEFHPDLIIVEPWNAASSVLMLPAIYWFLRLPNSKANHLFCCFRCSWYFRRIGQHTFFHAFRISPVFLFNGCASLGCSYNWYSHILPLAPYLA